MGIDLDYASRAFVRKESTPINETAMEVQGAVAVG